MSESELERLENEGGPPEPDQEAVTPPADDGEEQETSTGWAGPSQEDWQATQAAIQRMASYFEEEEEPEPLQAPEGITPEQQEYFLRLMQQSLAPVIPALQASTQDAGKRRMNEEFDRIEKNPEIGKFDRKLAEFYAEEALPTVRDPIKALEIGASQAAEVRKRERAEGIEEYKKSLRRTGSGDHDDGRGSGSGNKPVEGFKTYEEVADWYAAQTEV